MEINDKWKPRPFQFQTDHETSVIETHIEKCKSKVDKVVDIKKIEEFKKDLMVEAAMVELHFAEMVQKLTITNKKGKTRQLFLDNKAKQLLLDVFKKNYKLDESSFEMDRNLGKELQDKFGVNENLEDYVKEVYFKIKNYCSAQKFALDVRDKALTIEIVKKIHKLLIREKSENEKKINAGEFRNGSVSTDWDSTTHPDHKDVNSSLENLIDCVNKEIENLKWTPYTIAAYFLYKFYIIHPFVDGNGRVGRIIASAILYWCGFKFLVVLWFPKNPVEENVFKMRKKAGKKHNQCLDRLSRNQREYFGGNLAYMFLKSHCQTLERFSSFHEVQ